MQKCYTLQIAASKQGTPGFSCDARVFMLRSRLAFVRIIDIVRRVFLRTGYHAFRHGRHASALYMHDCLVDWLSVQI